MLKLLIAEMISLQVEEQTISKEKLYIQLFGGGSIQQEETRLDSRQNHHCGSIKVIPKQIVPTKQAPFEGNEKLFFHFGISADDHKKMYRQLTIYFFLAWILSLNVIILLLMKTGYFHLTSDNDSSGDSWKSFYSWSFMTKDYER